MLRKQVGDALKSETITAIHDDSITLQAANQPPRHWGAQESQAAFQVSAAVDVSAMTLRFHAGAMTESAWIRLGQLARLGSPEALRLLQQIATTGGSLAQRSTVIPGETMPLANLLALIEQARNPKSPQRQYLIAALGDIPHALSAIALEAIAANDQESDELRLLAVRAMARHGDACVARQLESLAARPKLPEPLRAAIYQLRNELIHSMAIDGATSHAK